jgi:hypothetical protein
MASWRRMSARVKPKGTVIEEATIMNNEQIKIRSAVRRDHAESYVLTCLVAFAVTVIVTRVYLELAGYPQLGNSVLHIAHALWGGLLLFVAALLPLALANRWAIEASALLGGRHWAFHRRGGQIHYPGQRLLLPTGPLDRLWLLSPHRFRLPPLSSASPTRSSPSLVPCP